MVAVELVVGCGFNPLEYTEFNIAQAGAGENLSYARDDFRPVDGAMLQLAIVALPSAEHGCKSFRTAPLVDHKLPGRNIDATAIR